MPSTWENDFRSSPPLYFVYDTDVIRKLDFSPTARVTFLTGAGVSVASGIRPFRGPGGLWNEVDVESWATSAAIARDPQGCFQEHHKFAVAVAAAKPNAAHLAIAAFAREHTQGRVAVITQNVDRLHQRAGSENVVEIHGSLFRLRCTDDACAAKLSFDQPTTASDEPPVCPQCARAMRYDIVLFDEYLDPQNERAAKEVLRNCDVFIAVGTSGVVFPAASYVREADFAGARTYFVNIEAPSPPNPYFDEVFVGRAEEVLPVLLGVEKV
jgi:NAD-dependent deacetylase